MPLPYETVEVRCVSQARLRLGRQSFKRLETRVKTQRYGKM